MNVSSVARRTSIVDPAAREMDPWWLLLIALIGAALSLLMTGYSFGIGNNYFHLPIIERLYDEPQFRDDAFIQSLRYFAAGPFLILEGSARFVAPEFLFPILNYLSRVLLFVGMLLCAGQLGVTSRPARAVFAVLLSFVQIMRGFSYAGGGGLFVVSFTHSEIANGLLLISIYFATSGRFTLAFTMNGLVFFTNAFMAVWNALPLGFIIALLLYDRRVTLAQTIRRCLLGLVGFIVLAYPVLRNVLSNPDFGRPLGLDYRVFLDEFWPYHFIFGPNPLREKVILAALTFLGILAFLALGRRSARYLHAALWGFVGVYAIGIVVPLVTGSALLLNMHLLRSGAGIHLLTALAAVSLATTWLFSDDARRATVFGPLLALSICTVRLGTAFAPLIVAMGLYPPIYRRIPQSLFSRRFVSLAVTAVLLLVAWTVDVIKSFKEQSATYATVQDWRRVGEWANTSTAPAAMFMLPTNDYSKSKAPDEIQTGDEIFQFVAHRQVWVEFRSGAAVMWSPSYYPVWHERVQQQVALSGLPAQLVYAQHNGIDFIVDGCQSGEPITPVFQIHDLCVYASRSPVPSALKG